MFKIIIKMVVFLGLSVGLYAESGLSQNHLLSVSPSASETGVSPDTSVEVKFDLLINEKSVKKHTIVLKQNHEKIKGITTLVCNDTLCFTPNETLEEGNYTVKVKKVKLQNEDNEAQHEPKTGFEKFIYWLCSLFYDNPADCTLCKKICGNSNNSIKTQKINYSFTVEDSPKIVSMLLSETAIELNEGNTSTLSVTVNYDDNTTQEITNEVEWVIGDSSIVSIANGTVKALKEGKTTLQAKYNNIVSSSIAINVYKEINGYRLPPEPDRTVNDSTLLGVDSNGNGVRDDVERYIVTRYAQDPKYPKTKTAIALQYAWASQKILENPTMESSTIEDDVLACQSYWFHKKLKHIEDQIMALDDNREAESWELMKQIIKFEDENKIFANPKLKDKFYNTKERIEQYFKFNATLSGNIFDGREENITKCKTNIDELGE